MKKFFAFVAVFLLVAGNLLAQNPIIDLYIPSYNSWNMEFGEQKQYNLSVVSYSSDIISFRIKVDPNLIYVSNYSFDDNAMRCSFFQVENEQGIYAVVLWPIAIPQKLECFTFSFFLSAIGTGRAEVGIQDFCAAKEDGARLYAPNEYLSFEIRDYVAKYYPYFFQADKIRTFSLPSAEMNGEKIMRAVSLFPNLYIWEWIPSEWIPGDGDYRLLEPDDELRAGVGYWGLIRDPNQGTFFVLHENPTKNCRVFSTRLKLGWNLVGSYYQDFQPNDQSMPREATSVFSWDWRNESCTDIWGKYDMSPGNGYWVSSNGSAVMFFNGGVPTPPSLGKAGSSFGELPPAPPQLPKATKVGIDDSVIPTEFSLMQNYPNPFNPTTTISFELPRASEVQFTVFDAVGQVIKNLVSGTKYAGAHQVVWDGRDENGLTVPSGVYFYRIIADGQMATRQMMLVR